jgi:hypothetical protein
MKPEDVLEQIQFLKELTQQTAIQISKGFLFFILWGLIWMIGYIGEALSPVPFKATIWAILCTIGMIGSIIIFARIKDRIVTPLSKKLWLLNIILGLAAMLIFGALYINPNYYFINAYWAFQIGVIYMINGIFIDNKLIFIGIWTAGASLVSLLFPTLFSQCFWLAITSDGGLMITGIILRKKVNKVGP